MLVYDFETIHESILGNAFSIKKLHCFVYEKANVVIH